MKWNVYLKDMNNRSIKVFNIFDHCSFKKEIESLKSECYEKENFSKELRRIAMYYFWSKCEYEIVITSWPPYVSQFEVNQLAYNNKNKYHHIVNLEVGEKISVFDQLDMNWEAFVDYVWNERD